MLSFQSLRQPVPYAEYNGHIIASACREIGGGDSVTLQATTTGDWPVYAQWDGQSYKYVVMRDANEHQATPATDDQQYPHQPRLLVISHQDAEGKNMQVLHCKYLL